MINKRLLLCDDEVHIIRPAELKLTKAGFDVQCAHDGEEGWAAILKRPPDLLITDCQMPRLDGFGLCRRVRDNPETRHIAILMLTAKGFELSHEEVKRRFQVLAVLPKPFSPRQLVRLATIICTTGTLEGVSIEGHEGTADGLELLATAMRW